MANEWVDETNLTDALLDVDKAAKKRIFRNLRDRDLYLFDSALRGGTFAAPVRNVYARGKEAFSVDISSINPNHVAITRIDFSSSQWVDGDSLTEPFKDTGADLKAYLSIEEGNGLGFSAGVGSVLVQAHVVYGTLNYQKMDIEVIAFRPQTVIATSVDGWVHWLVIGTPETGE